VGGCGRVLRVALARLWLLVVGTAGPASAAPARTIALRESMPLDPPPVPPALPFDQQADARNVAEITTDEALATQPATRAFGTEPYRETTAAAASEASAPRAAGCSISDARLAGIMLAITVEHDHAGERVAVVEATGVGADAGDGGVVGVGDPVRSNRRLHPPRDPAAIRRGLLVADDRVVHHQILERRGEPSRAAPRAPR
jgi:hypothetical protein